MVLNYFFDNIAIDLKNLLQNIATFQPGVYLKASENGSSNTYLLGIKDFDDDFVLNGTPAKVNKHDVKEKYIVKKNDVLFSTRLKFHAFYLPVTDDVFVASNSFIIIKPDIDKVNPDYLRWFLNHGTTQQQISNLAQGTGRVSYLNQKKLGMLEVWLPQKKVQEDIVKINELLLRERQLTIEILEKKNMYYQNILINTSKK